MIHLVLLIILVNIFIFILSCKKLRKLILIKFFLGTGNDKTEIVNNSVSVIEVPADTSGSVNNTGKLYFYYNYLKLIITEKNKFCFSILLIVQLLLLTNIKLLSILTFF